MCQGTEAADVIQLVRVTAYGKFCEVRKSFDTGKTGIGATSAVEGSKVFRMRQ